MKRLGLAVAVCALLAGTVGAWTAKDFLRGGKWTPETLRERLLRAMEQEPPPAEAKPAPFTPVVMPKPKDLIKKRRFDPRPYFEAKRKEMEERLRKESEGISPYRPRVYRPLEDSPAVAETLARFDAHTTAAATLEEALVSSEERRAARALAATVTASERCVAQMAFFSAAEQETMGLASATALSVAVEGFGSGIGNQMAKVVTFSREAEQAMALLGKSLGGLLQEEDLPEVQRLLKTFAETGQEAVRQELRERLLAEDWPSDRCRDTLLAAVDAIGTKNALATAHQASVVTAAEFIRAAGGDDGVTQNVANAVAKYVEAVGMGGVAGGRDQLLTDIDKHITDPQAKQTLKRAIYAVGQEGTDYLALGEQVSKELVVEVLNQYDGWADEETKQKAIAAIRNGEGIDWGSLGDVANVQGRYLLAAQVSAMLHDKLGEKEAEALSNITDNLINAGTEEALAQARTELKGFVSEYAPGESAADVNAWIDSFGNDKLSDKQKEALRTQAVKSAAKGWGHDQIDKADHLTDEQKAAYKQQIDAQIDAGDYAGAMVDIGRVAAGEFIETKLGPGTGSAFDDLWDTVVNPGSDLGDIAESALDLGVVAGKNYLNKVAGEWVDGYLNRHEEVRQALAFFGIDGEDIKAGISNVLNVLTDKNLDLKGKLQAIAEMAVKALSEALTTALNNAISVVKQWLAEWTQKMVEKVVAVVAKVEAKINAFLQKHGSIITVGFTDEVRSGLELLRQGGLKAASKGLDAFGEEAQRLFKESQSVRKTTDGREIGKVYEATPEQIEKAKRSPYYDAE